MVCSLTIQLKTFFRVNEQNAKAKTVAIANRKRSLLDEQIVFGPFVRAYFLWFKEYLTHKTFAKAYEPFQLYCFDPLF